MRDNAVADGASTIEAVLPFTSAQFFQVFADYNEAIWPVQIVAYGLGLLTLAALVRGGSDRFVAGTIAAMWAWTGIAYHVFFFGSINAAAYGFGVLFVAQSAAFLWTGVLQGRLHFGWSDDARCWIGAASIGYAALVYPAVGMALGHAYRELPQFGVTPCPLVIFTFGCFLLLRTPAPWWMLAIPIVWSLIGGTAAFLLAVPQDWVLPASGVGTAALLAWKPPLLRW